MPHDRSALSDQLRALLTQQRFNSVVVHNYCRSAEHFLEYLAQRDIAVGAATREHVSRPRWPELPPASRSSASAAGGNPFLVRESMSYCAWCRNDGRRSHRLRARLKPGADRYATSTRSGCMCKAVSRKCPSARSSGGRHSCPGTPLVAPSMNSRNWTSETSTSTSKCGPLARGE